MTTPVDLDRDLCHGNCLQKPSCVAECLEDASPTAAALAGSVVVTVLLLCMSGFFSGLTLGLMSLDMSGLELIDACGEPRQRAWARTIMPVRRQGNLLLCTLLLGNTAVNSFIAIFTADLTAGAVGAVLSTAFILVFGEIIPQSVCSKYGLMIGAKSVPLVRVFIVMFYVLAWPISKVLDFALGRELRTIYNRKELDKLLSIAAEDPHGDLRPEEKHLMSAALEFGEKSASMIMTKLDHMFSIDIKSKLSFEALLRCYKSGYTRIPVYAGDKSCIVGLLFAKDLILVDPDDEIPVTAMLSFCGRSIHAVRHDTKLDKLLAAAQTLRSHLFFVVGDNEHMGTAPSRRKPPLANVIGIVTLEDVLEELIAAEIVDETDTIRDNHTRALVNANLPPRAKRMDFFYSIQAKRHPRRHITEDEQRAITTFLMANADPFKHPNVTHKSIRKLLYRCPVHTVEAAADGTAQEPLYAPGKPADQCCLLLSGQLRITVGADEVETEAGPWSVLALAALTQSEYVPDYTATVMGTTRMLLVSKAEYLRMLSATEPAAAPPPTLEPIAAASGKGPAAPPASSASNSGRNTPGGRRTFDWDSSSHYFKGAASDVDTSLMIHYRRHAAAATAVPASRSVDDFSKEALMTSHAHAGHQQERGGLPTGVDIIAPPQMARSQSHPDLSETSEVSAPLCELLANNPAFTPSPPPQLRSLLSDNSMIRTLGALDLANHNQSDAAANGPGSSTASRRSSWNNQTPHPRLVRQERARSRGSGSISNPNSRGDSWTSGLRAHDGNGPGTSASAAGPPATWTDGSLSQPGASPTLIGPERTAHTERGASQQALLPAATQAQMPPRNTLPQDTV